MYGKFLEVSLLGFRNSYTLRRTPVMTMKLEIDFFLYRPFINVSLTIPSTQIVNTSLLTCWQNASLYVMQARVPSTPGSPPMLPMSRLSTRFIISRNPYYPSMSLYAHNLLVDWSVWLSIASQRTSHNAKDVALLTQGLHSLYAIAVLHTIVSPMYKYAFHS